MRRLQFYAAPTAASVGALHGVWSTAPLLCCLILATIAFRIAVSGLYPLSDNTEARYAEIARAMFATGDWVTLWLPGHVPFWAKPPLSTWASAAGISVLGANEWGVRLPVVGMAAVASLMVGWWARTRSGGRSALYALALLWGSASYFSGAGAVMTDMALCLSVVTALGGFRLTLMASDARSRRWGALGLYSGLALGLLAKGPIAAIFTLVPITIQAAVSTQALTTLRQLPWLKGLILTTAVAAPWYLISELRTPGFLEYFLIGEHWQRFTQPGWEGDLYGTAHEQARGLIWPLLAVGVLPWTILLPWLIVGRRAATTTKATSTAVAMTDTPLLVAWALVPIMMFSFSRNILWTYVLPALPALAILGGAWLDKDSRAHRVQALLCVGLASTILLSAALVAWQHRLGGVQSAKSVLAHVRSSGHSYEEVSFFGAVPYSASFYSQGAISNVTGLQELLALDRAGSIAPNLSPHSHRLLIVARKTWYGFDPRFRDNFSIVADTGGYVLVERTQQGSQRMQDQALWRMTSSDPGRTEEPQVRPAWSFGKS